jgi:hypothetical protein
MGKELNLQYELRAYEDKDACRLAAILWLGHEFFQSVSRAQLAENWASLYPRHAGKTGKYSIASRVSGAIRLLRVAGIVRDDGQNVHITNVERLKMSAQNLLLIMNRDGIALPPSKWTGRPKVPSHLLSTQEPIEAARRACRKS